MRHKLYACLPRSKVTSTNLCCPLANQSLRIWRVNSSMSYNNWRKNNFHTLGMKGSHKTHVGYVRTQIRHPNGRKKHNKPRSNVLSLPNDILNRCHHWPVQPYSWSCRQKWRPLHSHCLIFVETTVGDEWGVQSSTQRSRIGMGIC